MNTLLVIFNPDLMTITSQQGVIAYLKTTGSWARLFPSSWLVRTTKSAAEIRDELNVSFPGSRLAIFNVANTAWATTFSDEVTNWMKQNV